MTGSRLEDCPSCHQPAEPIYALIVENRKQRWLRLPFSYCMNEGLMIDRK